MKSNASIVRQTDLTPWFTEDIKDKKMIEAARLVERSDGSKAVEIKYCDSVPKPKRSVILLIFGKNLLNMCADLDKEENEENRQFLEFMDGAQVKEWEE